MNHPTGRIARGLLVAAPVAAIACVHAPTPSVPAVPAVPAPSSATVDLTRPPKLGPPPSVTLPPIISRTLPNGLKLVIVEQHELPVADFILVVHSGGEADPVGRGGLASLTAAMLDEGTAARNALQISDQGAYLGAQVAAGSGWDESEVLLHTTTAHLDSALALFADVALHPSFPGTELERLRKERLTSLIQLKDRAPAIADRAFASIVYGADHPYGHALTGTDSSVGAIHVDDVRQFYESHYRPNNATLIVVGDIKPVDIEQRAARLFGQWTAQRVPSVVYGNPPAAAATAIYLINKPGAAQSSFRIGGVGVPRSTKDYFALEVMNTVLGGSFTSRLNQDLREVHGYTYGASSEFAMRRAAGPFTARAEVVAVKTDSAFLDFMKELNGIRDTVPQAELEKTKRYLELELPGDFESTEAIARQLIPVVLYDLPLDYYDGYVRHIDAVTQQDVQQAATTYIDPAHMVVVIVGDRAAIEGGLRALHAAPISIRGLDGQPVR